MKSAVFLLVTIQLLTAESRVLNDELQPCHKKDPNVNRCFLKYMPRLFSMLVKGIPELGLRPYDPFVVASVNGNVDIQNLANGTVTARNMEFRELFKMKFQDVKFDKDNLVLDMDFSNPKIYVDAELEVNGHLLDFPIHFSGWLKAKFLNVETNLKIKLGSIERRGVKYFTVESFISEMDIEDASAHFTSADSRQQAIANFIHTTLNQNSKEYIKMMSPLISNMVNKYFPYYFNEIYSSIPADMILQE